MPLRHLLLSGDVLCLATTMLESAMTDPLNENLSDKDTRTKAEEQMSPSLQVPAIWVDRFVVSFSGDRVRIAFAEMAGSGVPHFREAIALSPGDALALANLLSANIKLATEKASTSA